MRFSNDVTSNFIGLLWIIDFKTWYDIYQSDNRN